MHFPRGSSLLLFLLQLHFVRLPQALAHLCYSCSGLCPAGAPCNCQMGSCEADHCFAEKRPSELAGQFRLAKGCVKKPQRTRPGCDFEHFADHVQCTCSGDYCNDSVLMRVHTSRRNVTCRNCPEGRPHCGQTCQGQWCHLRVPSSASGCGYGPPSLPYLYQTPEMLRHRPRVCLSMSRGNGSPHQYCVCNHHLCNDPEAVASGLEAAQRHQRLNPFAAFLRSLGGGGIQQPQTQQQQQRSRSVSISAEHQRQQQQSQSQTSFFDCVNCDMSSEDAALTSNCRQNRCRGHFCVYATQRMFVGGSFQSHGWSGGPSGIQSGSAGASGGGNQQAMMHEKRGCINVTDRSFVQLGCAHKWVANEQEEIYCACRGDLCNADLSTASGASALPSPVGFPPWAHLFPTFLLLIGNHLIRKTQFLNI